MNISPFIIIFLWALSTTPVASQRVKQGCFDAFPVSCDITDDMAPPLSGDTDPEAVCTFLSTDIFPSQDILFDVDQVAHAEYLNGIEASDPLCEQIRQVYHKCFFCLEGTPKFQECGSYRFWTRCGELPSREEILSNNTAYPLFKTDEDIAETCKKLDEAYDVVILKDWGLGIPSTVDLCARQTQVRHLCPGVCPGGCFDVDNPPSCLARDYEGPFDEELETWDVCSNMENNYLRWMGDDLSDLSKHGGYLQAIPGNSTECDQAKQSYSECYWCQTDRCFNEDNPASCEKPPDYQFLDDDLAPEDVNVICQSLHNALWTLETDDELYNISMHTEVLWHGDNTSFCDAAKQYYHQCYWCLPNRREGLCGYSWCTSEATIPEDYVVHPQLLNISSPEGLDNCTQVVDLWQEIWEDNYEAKGCYRDVFVARQCPELMCDIAPTISIDLNYLGATTTAEKLALIWMSRAAAILSFGGASYILYTILTSKRKLESIYYQLLICVAVADIWTAAAWTFATAPIDQEQAGHVQGAIGNEATCKAQAFFIQLGFASIFYNVSLAVYYILVISYGWKESQLKKIRVYLMAPPLLLGLALAFGGIPLYHWIEYGCHILPPPEGDMWVVLVFVVLPLGLSILAITAALAYVYYTVQLQSKKAKRWSLVGRADKMRSKVLWQCVCYVLAFYITWPILFSVYLASVDVNGPLGLTVTVAFVAPLQGFSNFLVFIRPQLLDYWKNRKKKGEGQWMSGFQRSFRSFRSRMSTRLSATIRKSTDMSTSGLEPSKQTDADLIENAVAAISSAEVVDSLQYSRRNNVLEMREHFDPSALLPLLDVTDVDDDEAEGNNEDSDECDNSDQSDDVKKEKVNAVAIEESK